MKICEAILRKDKEVKKFRKEIDRMKKEAGYKEDVPFATVWYEVLEKAKKYDNITSSD